MRSRIFLVMYMHNAVEGEGETCERCSRTYEEGIYVERLQRTVVVAERKDPPTDIRRRVCGGEGYQSLVVQRSPPLAIGDRGSRTLFHHQRNLPLLR